MAAGDPGVLKRNFSATAIETTLVNSISSAATGDTTTSVSVVSVSGYPAAPFTLILAPDTNKEEVVTCTSIVGTTLQIVRGQDQTLAVSHTAGTSVRHGVSGRDFKEEQTHIAARGFDTDSGILANASQTHVHGLVSGDGSVVGSDQVATLTRKTLTTPTINGATLTGTVTASTATIASPTITSPTISGSPVITGLSSAGMSASSAAPKSYVDALITTNEAYAVAAATSATLSATSATSAATSASSASASATAAATSATSAAASATAAATSAASAATSASTMGASVTAAATSAASAATSATAAATSASSALTSQTAAATSATSAAASATAAATSATSAAASATAAATSATSAAASATTAAASVATIAGYSANADAQASAAATSATSAAASATAAATSATSAAASATTASNSAATATTQAGNASASATAAATSATSAAASATAATTSATSAATSASSASASATAAASSATAAAASYELFDDRYLGPKATAPTVDNDGNPLTDGVIYYNTTDYNMYVWNGSTSSWQVFTSSGDITAVVAGTGMSGGGTSGSVTLDLSTSSVYVVPSQATHSGKYLTTDGSTASWGTIQAGSQVKIDGGAASTYDYIDFTGMGTNTGTAGTVKVSPITVTDSDAGKRIFVGTVTPTSPTTGDVWIDETIDTDPDLRTMTIMGAY